MGCLDETRMVAGFFDPITHVWVAVETRPWGEIADARLGRGLPREDGSSAWWPFLIEDEGGVMAAIQSASVQQVGAFTALFDGEACAPLDDLWATFDATEAAGQIHGIATEWRTFDPENAEQAITDLYAAMKSDRGDLYPTHFIMLDPDTVLVPFRDPNGEEWIFMSRWEVNMTTGKAQIHRGRTLEFMPQPAEDGEASQ